MIIVKFEEKGESLCMSATGHAGAAGVGEDLICAGATMLMYTLAQAVCFLQEQGHLAEEAVIRIGEGDAVIAAVPGAAWAEEVRHTFRVVQTGFRLLAHNYPENVRLEAMELGDK